MLDIKLDRYNIINKEDEKYYYSCYKLGFNISNAINPIFLVYANDEMQSIEILLDKLLEGNQEKLYFETEIPEEYEEDYLYVDGGYYINLGYFHIEEVKN